MTLRTFKLVGQVDEQHRLSVEVPTEVPPGPVKVILEVASGRGGRGEHGLDGGGGERLGRRLERSPRGYLLP